MVHINSSNYYVGGIFLKKAFYILVSVFLGTLLLLVQSPKVSAQNDVGVVDERLINVREPINETDAATKKYVDDAIDGLDTPPAVLQTIGQSETAVMSQKAVTNLFYSFFDLIYPVGSIYMSVSDANPGDLFSGIWVGWGTGRVPVGVDVSDTNFNVVEKTGGEKTHTLTIAEMPSHYHNVNPNSGVRSAEGSGPWEYQSIYTSSGGVTTWSGGNGPHNNLQSYITCYMWKRIG